MLDGDLDANGAQMQILALSLVDWDPFLFRLQRDLFFNIACACISLQYIRY